MGEDKGGGDEFDVWEGFREGDEPVQELGKGTSANERE